MMYGNKQNGYGYSPDRSKDVDRFNQSTKTNYYANMAQHGDYDPTKSYYPSENNNNGYYDGAGRYHKN